MDKSGTLIQLRDAKRAHIKWVQRAKALIEGLPVEKEAIPVDCTECKFGTWFYGEGQSLYAIPGMDCMKEIETLHFELHDIYMKIFKIYFGELNRSFFSKLFNLKQEVTQEQRDISKEYYTNLLNISSRLLEVIEKLERRLHAMNNKVFQNVG